MDKKALVILADGFEEIEAITPIDILRRAGIEVVVAGLTDLKITGSRKAIIVAQKLLDDVDQEFDALVLPGGGFGAKNLAASSKVSSLIKAMNEKGKMIAAICASPAVVLAPTGILEKKSATCFPGMEDKFGANTRFVSEPVVVDGNIITSRGAGTAIDFSLKIIEKLISKQEADKIAQQIVLK